MRYVAWEGRLNVVVNGRTQREEWASLARRGDHDAQAALTPPPFPEPLDYLAEWSADLASGRQVGMNGPVPLSWLDVHAWAQLTGRRLTEQEARALLSLDRVRLYPEQIPAPEGAQ
jgi:hypothetical protein